MSGLSQTPIGRRLIIHAKAKIANRAALPPTGRAGREDVIGRAATPSCAMRTHLLHVHYLDKRGTST
eukprot:14151964-Alexandrium_andersonii.AAC.1